MPARSQHPIASLHERGLRHLSDTPGNQERRDVFDAAAERLDTLATYIEKDFWVCRVLDALYHGLPNNHPRLLFKGGTSLSKAFSAIHRFSEDIDMVVFRNDLGFTHDRDPTREDLGRKKSWQLC